MLLVCAVVLRILHRDEQVVAVDKPAGILTVPGRGDTSETLVAQVRAEAPSAMAVHRLDRNTSGVVVFALGRKVHRELNAAFEGRRAEKTYLALVRGDLSGPQRIDLPLAGTRRGGMRIAGDGERAAQAAVTDVEPRERFGNYTLCTCKPRTGRTHQNPGPPRRRRAPARSRPALRRGAPAPHRRSLERRARPRHHRARAHAAARRIAPHSAAGKARMAAGGIAAGGRHGALP